MLLSVENMIIRRRIGDKAAVDLLKEAGFTGIDYSLCGMEDWDAVAGSKNALSYAEDLCRCVTSGRVRLHCAIDTGMTRIGLTGTPEENAEQCSAFFSHFSLFAPGAY